MFAVIRAGGLGDVLLTLPAVQWLNASRDLAVALDRGLVGWPRTPLQVAGYPAFWRAAGPLVDRVDSIDESRFGGLYADDANPELLAWLGDRPIVVAWTVRPLGAWVEGAALHYVQTSPYPPPGVHAADWLLDSVAPLLEHVPRSEPEGGWLALSPMERQLGRALLAQRGLERPIVIHPGAGAPWKRWPAASFAALARTLRGRGAQIALVEGPADEDAVAAVLAETGPLPVIREPDLRALARMLSQARLFIGNDSGVTHLAAMAGAPTIALFGPTDPASWAPLGDVHVLRRCQRRATRQGQIRVCDDPECMSAIAVDEVMKVY